MDTTVDVLPHPTLNLLGVRRVQGETRTEMQKAVTLQTRRVLNEVPSFTSDPRDEKPLDIYQGVLPFIVFSKVIKQSFDKITFLVSSQEGCVTNPFSLRTTPLKKVTEN